MGSSSHVCLIAALAILLLYVEAASSSLNNPTDQEALLAFKDSILTDPSHTLSSWNINSSNLCRWTGVICDNGSRRVYSLDVSDLGLIGSISPSLGNLSSLQFLYLQGNQLAGDLPDNFGSLSQLRVLNASSNLIQGPIPRTITQCSDLTVLDLSANLISGRIPPELHQLSKLQTLKLDQNQLTGAVPASIGSLSDLTTLDLGTNTLHGGIPGELGRLRHLQKLQLSINNLTGSLPPSLFNISSLNFFAVASNNLSGELPGDIGFRLPNLLLFHVCFNSFTGPIPPSLHNITKIQSIRMSHCYFTGTIPPGLGNLPNLTMYNIGFNDIVSNRLDFLTSLTNSTKLTYLAIDGNSLKGEIPESVGNLSTSLWKFYAGHNRISGVLPTSIGRLTSLSLLDISYNSVHGEIPPSISQLKELEMLGLAGNRFSGEIPAAIGSLSKLNVLDLHDNELEGIIPSSFMNYSQLASLDISSNRFTGSIPKEIFTLSSLTSLLNLSKNSFTGPLPEEIGRLENLVKIDISDNLLSGSISVSIGGCKSLQYLSMSRNSISGQIPDEIGKLKGLQSLDLSSNQLSGTIPDDLGKLQALQFLNLSFNNLEGGIPKDGIFAQNTSYMYLQGNPKLCTSKTCEKIHPSSSHGKLSKGLLITIILAVIIIALSLILVLGMLFLWRRGSVARVTSKRDSFGGQLRMVSYEELARATGNFNPRELIGTGGFGSVYRGVLSDGMEVAIKVLNLAIHGASKSFFAECEALRNVRHRNLVKILTLCSSWDYAKGEFCALVYEMMGNGSLEDWIRGRRRHGDGKGLTAIDRLRIAIDVASAMDYLHNDCEGPVVHCDLKPSNVMLDEDMNAKVGDFGLARLLIEKTGGKDSDTSTIGIKGSIGYIPPEYGFGGKPSTRGDIYSYGIMMLELLTGKSPTDEYFHGDLSLERWVRSMYPARSIEVLDAELLKKNSISYNGRMIDAEELHDCLVSMVGVGLACAVESPDARITMRSALHQLVAIDNALMKPRADHKK